MSGNAFVQLRTELSDIKERMKTLREQMEQISLIFPKKSTPTISMDTSKIIP
ncbi:MAG: hypothetical protein ACTSVZ_05330 [Promethearchaeota archaeon]